MGEVAPFGARNRLQGDLLKALAEDFAKHGAEVIRIVRVEKPVEYLKAAISLLPREMVIESTVITDLSDEEVARLIAVLQRKPDEDEDVLVH